MRRNLTLFTLCMMLSSYMLAQTCTGPLAGTYTLGTPTSDYPTFGDALLDLQACGVSAAVTFNVAPGTYTGHIGINPITGTSVTNTVTFDGGTASGTILTHDGLGTNQNATVLLDEADYITFRNFTINTTGTNDSWCVNFYEDADFNTIDNCILNAPPGLSDVSPILMGGSYNNDFSEGEADNNTISNNTINGGERSIIMEGDFSPLSLNNQVLNNVMQGMDDYGIYMDNQDGVVIFGNTIGAPVSTFGDGLYCFDIMNFTIAGNDIQAQDWGVYISDGNFDFTPSQRGIVVNNMVQSFNDYGMYFIDFEETDIWHNTVIGEPAIRINDFPGLDIRNNIFVSNDDYAFEADDPTAFLAFDYNIFFRRQPGSLIRYSSVFADLAAFQAANPTYNINSIESEPGFASATDLHSEGVIANDVGDLTVGVSIDIDGDTRPAMGAASVDIGADEFTPPANDAGVSARVSPFSPTPPGFAPIELTVENFGLDTLYNFEIGWSINGTPQPTVSYNINANPLVGSNTANYFLANYNWPNNFSSVRAWTQNPNGTVDERFDNDTLEFLICPGLSGTYTVGTPTSDFPTLADAEFALSSCGVSGAVVFELQPGTYNGPLVLNPAPGMSTANTVAFDGLNPADVTITHDGSGGAGQNVTVAIDGGDHYIVRNMTIEMSGPSNCWGVFLTNDANNNRIENNIINLPVQSGITSQAIVASNDYGNDFSEGNNANGTIVLNNTITGGEMGIHFEGGGFSGPINTRNFILNNTIQDVDDYGIYMDDQDECRVNGNSVEVLGSTFADGISLFDIMNFQIVGNYVVANDDGISVFDGNFDAIPISRGRIINNMVIALGSDGMRLDDVEDTDVFHNSVLGAPGIYLNDVNLDFRNNLCLGDNDYAVESPDPFLFATANHNLFFRFGTGDLLRYGTIYADLAAWQASVANGGTFDAASVEADPGIISPTDLHLTGVPANDAGDNSVIVLQDIDGDSRPATGSTIVDIGADEFSVADNDAVLAEVLSPLEDCGQTTDSVVVIILNQGLNPISNFPITADIAGPTSTTLTAVYTDTLASGVQDTVFLGTLNTFNGGFFDITAYTQLTTDQDLSNDTLMTTVGITTSGPIAGVADTACFGSSAFLTVVPSPGLGYNWFSDSAGTNLVGVGDTFQTPPLTGATTFYVGPLSGGSVLTTYADNNTSQGMMFDVESVSNVTISAFDLHINPSAGSAVTVDVYYVSNNSYLGNNNNAGLWTLEGSYTVTSAGINNPTNLVLTGGGIPVIPGQTTAVFVDLPGSPGDMENTNGTTNYSDGTLTVLSGGETNGTFMGSFFNNRVFNGEVYYSVPACNASIVPVTASVNNVAPTVGLNGTTQAICSNATTVLDAGNPGATYAWSTGATTREITAMMPGTYEVTVTSAGCSAIDSAIVSYYPVPSITAAATDVSCNGGSDGVVDLTVLGGGTPYTFNWSNGATTEDISGLTAGAYTGTVTDGNGCSYEATVTVTQPDTLVTMLTNVDSVSCNGGQDGGATVMVMGGTAPYSFNWSTGATGNNVNSVDAGSYDVTVTDANGCSTVQSVTIPETNPLNVAVNVTDESFAYQGSANLIVNGGTAPYFYNWSSGQVTAQVDDLVAGTYQVVVTDVNGCQETITVVIDFFVPTDEVEGLETLSLFPNPTDGAFMLSFNLLEAKDVQLSIFDALGQEVRTYTSEITDGEQYQVDLSALAPGVYFARLNIDGQIISRRVVLQK